MKVPGGYVVSDGNAIHQGYFDPRGLGFEKEYLGRFESIEDARKAILVRANKWVDDKNYYANFGPG